MTLPTTCPNCKTHGNVPITPDLAFAIVDADGLLNLTCPCGGDWQVRVRMTAK